MTPPEESPHQRRRRAALRLGLLLLALAPFTAIALLGSQLYFRHDDASLLLWAKEFNSPLHFVFSRDPAVSPEMGGYWRPFNYLYVLALWSIFGPVPRPYFIVSGLTFLGAVYFLFRIAERRYGVGAAVSSCGVLFGAFGGSMYNLFHISVPITFLFQLAMIYSFWSYLRFHRWTQLMAMALLVVPAVGRQTTPFLLIAVLIATWLERRDRPLSFLRRNASAVAVLPVAFWVLTFSNLAVRGSVLQHGIDAQATWAFVSERILFYGKLLTSGVAGLLLLALLGGSVVAHLAPRVRGRGARRALVIAAILWTAAIWGHPAVSIPWLVLVSAYLVCVDEELRLPLMWSGASLSCFVAVEYYHQGYMLEAGFPLSLALGIVLERIRKATLETWRRYRPRVSSTALAVSCALAVALALGLWALRGKDVLHAQTGMIRTAIATNRNFARLIDSMAKELEPGARLYELDDDVLGVTRSERPHLSAPERAARVKVMGIEDTLLMLRVLQREDVEILPLETDGPGTPPPGALLITLTRFESEVARRRYRLTSVSEFCQDDECAGVYRMEPR